MTRARSNPWVDGVGAAILTAVSACACSAPRSNGAAPRDQASEPRAEEEATGASEEDGDDSMPPVTAREPASGEAATALLAEAERQLAAMRRTSYTHHTYVDEAGGVFDYDCSGFVDYALGRAVPGALAGLRAATVPRPLARHFVAFLSALPSTGSGRWRRVSSVRDLRPGDIVAWLRPAGSTSRNTGHVMIVRGAIVPDVTHPGAVIVPIVDSTATPHRPGDSRSDDGSMGLGRGDIVLLADDTGAPTHFRWSRGAKSRERASTIALGRLD